jgi:hypothetical protein
MSYDAFFRFSTASVDLTPSPVGIQTAGIGRKPDVSGSRCNRRVGWIPALGTRGFHRPLSDPATDSRGRGQTTSDGPFDGGDNALSEAAGEGHHNISGAGRDRPADGEGGPPSDHKIIPPADVEERHRPTYDKNDDGGDHDRKDESCLAFHACLGAFGLRYWATIKIASPALPLVSVQAALCSYLRPSGCRCGRNANDAESAQSQGPFPPPALPGFSGTASLSVIPERPTCPSRASG